MRTKRSPGHLSQLLAGIDVSENGFFQTREVAGTLWKSHWEREGLTSLRRPYKPED
jgi:hypothetical protein